MQCTIYVTMEDKLQENIMRDDVGHIGVHTSAGVHMYSCKDNRT